MKLLDYLGLQYYDAKVKSHIDAEVAGLQSQIDALGEPFRVKNFDGGGYDVILPCVTEDVANTDIPPIDMSIDDEEGAEYMIVGMFAYEMFDAANKRINCWPVCQFTQNTQKMLRVRMMCAGTSRKTVNRINCRVLLKHR